MSLKFVVSLLCFISSVCLSEGARKIDDPIDDTVYPMVKAISSNLTSAVGNPTAVQAVFDKRLGRLLHTARIAHYLAGSAWSKAKRPLKLRFREKVKRMIYDTYSELYLPLWEANVVRFYPLLADPAKDKKAVVRSVVDYADGRRVQVRYFVSRIGSRWRITDISLDDESIVEGLKHLFRFHLGHSPDLDYLMEQLAPSAPQPASL